MHATYRIVKILKYEPTQTSSQKVVVPLPLQSGSFGLDLYFQW